MENIISDTIELSNTNFNDLQNEYNNLQSKYNEIVYKYKKLKHYIKKNELLGGGSINKFVTFKEKNNYIEELSVNYIKNITNFLSDINTINNV